MGKTYFMLEIPSRMPDRDIYIFNKLPPEQYFNSKIKTKELREKIELLSDYENAMIYSDDILRTSNSKHKDQFFIGGRHNNLDIIFITILF